MALSQTEREALQKALVECNLPLEERWALGGQGSMPKDEWHSFDRTPWRHPWMTADNIRHFAAYSKLQLAQLEERLQAHKRKTRLRRWLRQFPLKLKQRENRYAFAGNMANVNYLRAAPLRRRNLEVDLVLHPHDDSIFAQPAWEDFDGEITELGENPAARLFQARLPDWVHRYQTDTNWEPILLDAERATVTPEQLLLWPEYMYYLPTAAALSHYDALLVSQSPYLGFFSGRPYLFGQTGGDIWLEASRNDSLGILTRKSIASSYAALVSNPITLPHARRYGLHNLLYVPWPLDEDVYSPGDSADIRSEWRDRVGGDFFVLTSMRMDRYWKGAQHALDGFVRFASQAPQARLLVLGWGDDLEAARNQVKQLGLLDRVLFLPTVGKKRLVRYLRAADVVIEQFVLGYYGASGLEAMACGKPTIMRIEREQYDALIDVGAPPTLDAQNGQEVERHLSALYGDRALCRRIGEQTRDWFIRAQSSQRWSKVYRLLLEAMVAGLPLSFSDSPLCEPLSKEELEYHAEQRASAPPFPHYVDP
ncbi:glycosyltransferase [Bradyrhizobium mercantei]|uniref:glycosyltransferase n=1 Tax=Bradyrhizobium mercantei TaxID=1904807 RepID=UPI000977E171|nr:glycosyltransferase [Bradyrhizobium mercantei]